MSYFTKAVEFDGSTVVSRATALTGANTATKKGIISVWVKDLAGAARVSNDNIFTLGTSPDPFLQLNIGPNDQLAALNLRFSDFTQQMQMQTVNGVVTTADYQHLLLSWDASINALAMYLDDVKVNDISFDFTTDAAFDMSGVPITVGSDGLNADLADLYYNDSEYIDLSVEANRRKFIDADGNPVDLGADGSAPTGTAPVVFLSGDASAFADNLGTGGAFTVSSGDLITADSSPSPIDINADFGGRSKTVSSSGVAYTSGESSSRVFSA